MRGRGRLAPAAVPASLRPGGAHAAPGRLARADVVYATATYAAAAAASSVARRPLVAKLVSDPAYERARRYGLFDGTLEEFQGALAAGPRAQGGCGRARSARARRSSCRAPTWPRSPSGWALRGDRILVLTNPAPPPRDVEPA